MPFVSRRLLWAPRGCGGCPLHVDDKIVPPEGDSKAAIAIVGEGPGRRESANRRPFIGPSGEHLAWLLAQARAPARRKLWITNAALCEPHPLTYCEDTPDEEWFPRAECVKRSIGCCRERLLRELEGVAPRVILAVGNHALESLTGRTGITKHHGVLLPFGESIVVPMLHPAALLRDPRGNFGVINVLKKAARLAERGPQHEEQLLLVSPYHPAGGAGSLALAEQWLDRLEAEGGDLAVDIETTSADARSADLTVFGFGSARYNLGVAVTVRAWNRAEQRFEACWRGAEAARVEALIARVCAGRLRQWYWNYRFDVTVLEAYGFHVENFADGLHLHWLLQPELSHTLAYAVGEYLDVGPWKVDFWTLQEAGKATHDDLLAYNARDALYTAQVVVKLKSELRARGISADLARHQLRVAELARRVEGCGVPVDADACLKLREELVGQQSRAAKVIADGITEAGLEQDFIESVNAKLSAPNLELCAAKFNPRSKYQASWFLFDFLGLPATRYTAGGEEHSEDKQEPSTSYKGFLAHLDNPLVRAYVDWGEAAYRLGLVDSVWRNSVEEGDRRVLYIPWNTTGMKGTRWTSKVVNMQNWEKAMRKLLRAPPGWKWVGADASAIEYRIAAALAGIPELLALFNQVPFDESTEKWKKYDPRFDGHSLVAVSVYGDEYLNAEPAAKEILRTLVKRVTYALFYGAHPPKIYRSLREDKHLPLKVRAALSEARVTEIWAGFKERFPEWDAWAEREMTQVTTKGYQIFPPFNRRRYWTTQTPEENKIRNTPIQLAAGDVCNIIFANIQDDVDAAGLEATMAIHAHDAIYLLSREEHAPAVRDIVNRDFHFQFPGPAGPVHIYGQASIGQTVAEVG